MAATSKRRSVSRFAPRKAKFKPVVIRKKAIEKFLNRPRDNCHEYKELGDAELERLMRKLPVRPPIWNKLRRPQKASLLLGAKYRKFAFFNGTGTGKTLLATALVRYFWKLGDLDRALALVPYRVNKWEWAREIEKHTAVPYIVLHGSTADKWRQLEENPEAVLVIETFGGLVRMACKETKTKKGKTRLDLDPTRIKGLQKLFQGVVADEATVFGKKDNLPRRIVRQLVKGEGAIYATLTGTPFGRDPSLVQSQMWLVDGGYSVGETLGLFRAAFYNATENNFGTYDYTFRKASEPLLYRMLAHRSIRFKTEEADLPRCVSMVKEVVMERDAEDWAERARQALQSAKGNYQETKNAFLRMRQISSGFIGYKDEDTSARAQFEFDYNPKLEMLISLIERVEPEDKVIVFIEFHYSQERIAEELKKAGIGFTQIYGKTKHPEKSLADFDNDPKKQVLLLSNEMAIGLNLQVAKYGIYYEAPTSSIKREQSLRRFVRQGSKHKTVFLIDLVTRGTYDQRILDFHKEGGDLLKAVLDGKVHL